MGSALKIRDDLTESYLWSFGAGLAWNRTVERRRGPMGSRMHAAGLSDIAVCTPDELERGSGSRSSPRSTGHLEEMPRADAARLAGMDRQTLRDAVVRYNAKGLEGLHDRPKGYSPRRLTADEEAALAAVIIAGPEPERDGVCAWTRADLCRWLEERFAKTYHPSSMTRVLRRMGFSRQKARPSHPRRDAEAQERFKKGGFATS